MANKNTAVIDRFATPTEMDAVSAAFGVADVRSLMPKYDEIPREFRSTQNKWVRFQNDWFYGGISKTGLIAKDGIDLKSALRHLAAIQGSFDPKHEHKEAAVAYLASRWLDDKSTWTVNKK